MRNGVGQLDQKRTPVRYPRAGRVILSPGTENRPLRQQKEGPLASFVG